MGLLNDHQKDVRQRVDSLCKAVFVLSGGALTISLGIFTNSGSLLNDCLKDILGLAWWALFCSIISLVFVLFTMICRDYFFGERLRDKEVEGKETDVSGKPGFADFIIWLFGLIGLVSFVVGYFSLAYVATKAIGT